MKSVSRAAMRATWILALPLALIALLFFALQRSQELQPAFPRAQVFLTGSMQRGGEFPGVKLRAADRVRNWGSWNGSDDNVGELRFGPFRAPKIIRFAAGGVPSAAGIRVFLKLADADEESAIKLPEIRETWRLRQHIVPPAWRGRPIFLCVIDSATGPGGWVSISEPVKGNPLIDSTELVESLTCWILNGFLLGCIFFSAAHFLRRTQLPAEWIPLLAVALVALSGYALFWIYFLNAGAGKFASIAMLVTGGIGAWRCLYRKAEDNSICLTSSSLVAISFFYLAILYLYSSPFDFYGLAANRFSEGLPPDNYLSYLVAKSLWHGDSLRSTPMGSWLVSDRPPLQTGWILLTYPFAQFLHLDERALSGTSALWLQTIWITAAYGLLRTLHLTAFRACAWIAVMALSGFFLQNTIFTWPKLAAGAFACGAFAFWFFPNRNGRSAIYFAIGGGLAALAWVAHGGVAFAFIPLAFYALWRVCRGEWKSWFCAAAIFFAIIAPWICFQKFYNPPGNRLLKWHLAGQIEVDPRGTFETLRDSYRSQPLSGSISAKLLNFKTQFAGDWASLFQFDQASAKDRRRSEFYYTARTLTWWWLWILFFPFLLLRRPRANISSSFAPHLALAAWTVSTIIVWCLLIFIARDAIIHQGPYTIELAAFVLFSALLEAASPWSLIIIALLQCATAITTYFIPNTAVHGKMIGLPMLIVAILVFGAVIFRGRKY